jgi:hypothetical protein
LPENTVSPASVLVPDWLSVFSQTTPSSFQSALGARRIGVAVSQNLFR